MEFGVDSAIGYNGKGSTIVHLHVVFVLETLNLGSRHALCNRLMSHLYQVVQPRDGLGCFAHGERVHLRAQADELDDRIALCFSLKVSDFSGM